MEWCVCKWPSLVLWSFIDCQRRGGFTIICSWNISSLARHNKLRRLIRTAYFWPSFVLLCYNVRFFLKRLCVKNRVFIRDQDVGTDRELLVCTWRHGGHIGDERQKHFPSQGTKLNFRVNSSRKKSIVWTTEAAALPIRTREWTFIAQTDWIGF